MKIYIETVKTPAGDLKVAASDTFLVAASFGKALGSTLKRIAGHCEEALELQSGGNQITKRAVSEIKKYFDGKLTNFSLPIKLYGTPFQIKSWNALQKIRFGQTVSYGEQAKMVGNPKGARAIGGANGRNPICVIVPCHRVIAHDGGIGGYTGGIQIKKKLLTVEGVTPDQR